MQRSLCVAHRLTSLAQAFVDSLQHIIERDYFPDLPRIRTKLKWLEAKEAGDVGALERCYSSETTRFFCFQHFRFPLAFVLTATLLLHFVDTSRACLHIARC